VPVPNVVGKTLAEATASISEKLTVGQTTTAPSAQYPEGSVISSNPPAGKEVAPGSPVDLVVSGGPPMPTVTDLGVGQAAEVLQTAKLLDRSTFVDANGRPADSGTVVKSDPAAGEAVSKNQQITLTVRPRGSG
jgi:serine/threonine-protein kinase